MSEYQKGERVRCWPGSLEGRSYLAEVISDGIVEFGGQHCYRICKDDGGTDYIAATHVRSLKDFQLGQRVKFSTHLQRRLGNKGTDEHRKVWSTTGRYPSSGEHFGGEGVIVGKRKLANGDRYWEEDYGYIFEPKEYLNAWLVAWDLHRKPVHVLPEHLTPLEES